MVLRDRFATDYSANKAVSFDYYRVSDNFFLGTTSLNYPSFTQYRRITDVVSNDSIKPVGSVVWSWECQSLQPYRDLDYRYVPKDSATVPGKIPDFVSTNPPSSIPTMFNDFYGSGTHLSLGNDSLVAFSAQIPEQTSVANFLWEARAIKEMIPKIERSLSKTAAGGYLNWSFGWKPFISDLKVFINLQQTVSQRLQWLKDTYGKKVRVGFSAGYPYPISLPRFTDYPAFGADKVIRLTLYDYKATYNATGYLYHELKGLDDSLAHIKAMGAALGLNNPTKVLWEAIPYSFVLDWFTDIGGLLDRISIQPFEGVWNITDVSHSLKESYSYYVDQRFYVAQGYNPSIRLGLAHAQRYNRYVGLPVSPAFLSPTGLTPSQQVLALALLRMRAK